MNLQEAYTILELSSSASPDDAKKKYKDLTKKYHPDINKEEGAEDRFKKINEAYQCVLNGNGNDREEFIPQQHPFNPFGGGFNPFGGGRIIPADPITLTTSLSFRESVLGCKRELRYARKSKCQECDGLGQKKINNGCDKCGGQGQVITQRGNMIITQTCDKCWGRTPTIPCVTCSSIGVVDAQASISVTVPGGIVNGNILRIGGMGNYMGNIMNSDQITDVMLHISVQDEPGLKIIGIDIVSDISISLLEALKGMNKTIKTIDGNMDVIIPPLSRNKEEIILPKLGVNGVGSHRIVLDVTYPSDIGQLIQTLEPVQATEEI